MKILTKWVGGWGGGGGGCFEGGTRLFLSVTKSVTKQKAKLLKFISESFVLSRTQETSFKFLC